MSDILQRIIAHKRQEVAQRRGRFPVASLENRVYFGTPTRSFSGQLRQPGSSGIIAEFKRRSPSQRDINLRAAVETVAVGYAQAGATALSILTDEQFFGGRDTDLEAARVLVDQPILRKDFIVDEYQIIEARSIGADAILLIASYLSAAEIRQFTALAQQLGMEVLAEVHDRAEIDKLDPAINAVGVNNRNLQSFEVSLGQSLALYEHLPAAMVKVSESGIDHPQAIVRLRECGYQGFLIGTYFMRHLRPAEQCRTFIQEVKRAEDLLRGAIA